ncbi:MAG TPA: hypothetical protein VEA69_21090 [Tepidisphaeraceae bacterium]|nr:hypothetical protein [Tepidisphaeraceae bacterium]
MQTDADRPATGIDLIAAERERQMTQEGWTPEHDDQHSEGELLKAADQYLEAADFIVTTGRDDGDRYFHGHAPQAYKWPWDKEWWKPDWSDPIRNLVKAGALIAAEIDRLKRKEPDRAN